MISRLAYDDTWILDCYLKMLLCLTFFAGVIVALFIEAFILYLWFKRQQQASPSVLKITPLNWNDILETLKRIESDTQHDGGKSLNPPTSNTAAFLNVIMLFLFQELRSDSNVRAQVLSRLNIEISEILDSKFNYRIIKTLCVHNFSIGTSPPKITNIQISKLKMCNETKLFRKLHISVDLEYNGCGKLALQATTFLGKNVYLSVEVSKLVGKLIIIFNRDPQTHWGFCFDTEPDVEFNIISSFQRRRLPKFTKVVTSILKHTIRRKHTKPQYKHRFAPLFQEPPIPLPVDQQLLIFREPLNKGKLIVNLISANRVIKINDKSDGWFYCTLSLGMKQWNAHCCPLNQNVEFDTIIKDTEGGIGINFKVESNQDQCQNDTEVVVEDIQKNSPASDSNIKHGDTITAINDKKVYSFKTALTQSLSAKCAKLSIKRPLVRWNKLFTSAEASQDMEAFQNDATKEPKFVEDEEFLILKELEENEILTGEPSIVEPSGPNDCMGCQSSEFNHNSDGILRTHFIPVTIAPFWDEYFIFKLKEKHHFLTICLWKETSNRSENPVLIGHSSTNLADIVLQCISTLDNTFTDSITLSLPSDLKWQDNIFPPIGSLPQILPKMKYVAGEIKLQLTYCFEDNLSCNHSFVVGQTQTSEQCSVCSKPIVHRTVFICSLCGIIKHEKCLHLSTNKDQSYLRRNTGTYKKYFKGYNVSHRKRSQTHASKSRASETSECKSFQFLRGTEKNDALSDSKYQEMEETLRHKIAERKALLNAKAQCHKVPQTIVDQLSKNEESIKSLINCKEQMAPP